MEQIYRRVKDIDEKIKNISLPYLDWKVLFLVSDNTSVSEINSLLNKDTESIASSLELLKSKGLLEAVEAESEIAESKTETVEETVEDKPSVEEVKEETPEIAADLDTETVLEEDEMIELDQLQDETESEVETEATMEVTEQSEEEKTEITEEEETESIAETQDLSEQDEVTAAEMTDFLDKVSEEKEPSVKKEDLVQEEKPSPEATKAATQDEEVISDVSKKTIMVIDDSIVIRKMIEIALEEEDYRIVTAISGKEGMSVLDKDNPSLVILDMMLPDMNGIDVLKTIKASKKIPVIMLSGKDSPQLIESAKEVGVDEFLPKPFRDEELVEKVKNLIG